MRIAVFTSGRQDWGILFPVVRAMQNSSLMTTMVIAGGMHARDGQAINNIDGCAIADFIAVLPRGDDDAAVARAAGETITALTAVLVKQRAEALVILGDRSETLAAGVAATCLRLPIIHLHGGEETTGAIDNACRHALTQLATLHFVAHQQFATRIINMGAQPQRVIVSGAPAIDALLTTTLLEATSLGKSLGIPHFGTPLIVCTYHPTTLASQNATEEINQVINGIEQALTQFPDAQVIVTRANCDAGGTAINNAFAAYAKRDSRIVIVSDLGTQRYWSLLTCAHLMLGNSSSGILEAPCFDLPVINIGERQAGRLRIHAVHDVPVDRFAISAAITHLAQRDKIIGAPHPTAYGDGQAAQRIRIAIEHFITERKHTQTAKAML
jgi:UDP-2,4-diacetamido-2,4,6-trideoxy-beta-L-idose 2-epimerase